MWSEFENQTPAAILVAVAKFPSFIIWGKTLKFFPKRKDPLAPPPPKKKAHLYDNKKKRCSVVLVDGFPLLLGEYLVFCGILLHQGNMRGRKNHEQQFIFFFYLLPSPQMYNCTLFIRIFCSCFLRQWFGFTKPFDKQTTHPKIPWFALIKG